MKIVHICQFLGVGGLERVLLSLCQEQIKRGDSVELVVYDSDRRWVNKFEEAGVLVHQDFQKAAGYDLKLLSYLEKRTSHADVVHTHDLNPALYLGPLRLIHTLKLKRRPVTYLHTTHGMEHLELAPKTKLYEAFIGMISPKIVTVSPKFLDYYQSQFFTKSSKVHHINNGTQLQQPSHRSTKVKVCEEFELDVTKPLGIYVARVVPLKKQKELIEFYRETNEQLLIVGPPGNDNYYETCQSRTSTRIKMTGARDDISHLLNGCDYFISSSAHEGLPIAVLEAAAAGLPCLLSDIPGHRTFNKEIKCVELFGESEDPTNFLDTFLQNGETLSKNFLTEIKKHYSSQAMALSYNKLYEELKC